MTAKLLRKIYILFFCFCQVSLARNYDPRSSRFLTQDPIGYDSGDGPNYYTRTRNNPLIYVDPDGRSSRRHGTRMTENENPFEKFYGGGGGLGGGGGGKWIKVAIGAAGAATVYGIKSCTDESRDTTLDKVLDAVTGSSSEGKND